MAYSYGDKRTSGNGVWMWLQGVRNFRKQEMGPNYIPKNLDINQKSNFVRDIVIAFLATKGYTVTKKQYHFKSSKFMARVQDNFTQFTVFVKENYKPQ